MKSSDRSLVTTYVAVSPGDAFTVFTREIDRWWKRGPRHRQSLEVDGVLRFEGGRLVELSADGTRRLFEVGRVLVWEPGARLVFEWRARTFAPDEVTEVEIRFEPMNEGTRVTLEHRGWDAIPAGHPIRDGLPESAFTDRIALWWGELATGLRAHVARRP
jgi:uncharacterized protein YndB with AHSA1/START domain